MPPTETVLIRVALVEDDEEFQRTLQASVLATGDMEMCGIAMTAAQGLGLLEQPSADVLVVDLGLPDGSGIDVIRHARRRWPGCHALVSTTFGDERHVMGALEAGACGYLLKDSSPGELLAGIRCVHAGGSPVTPLIARQVLRHFHRTDDVLPIPSELSDECDGKRDGISLSQREREVLEHVMKGFTPKEIARLMGISYHTVQTYVRRAYEKLKVTSRSEAIFEARLHGLVRD